MKKLVKIIKTKLKLLKQELGALYLVSKRKDLVWYKKVFIISIIAYAFSPLDLIPDFIPLLGALDDLVIIPLGIYMSLKMIPKKMMDECRLMAKDLRIDKNWYVGSIIIIIWICMIIWTIERFFI